MPHNAYKSISVPPEALYAFAAYAYDFNHGALHVEMLKGGLINRTYRISTVGKPDFLLQRINKNVFRRPAQVQENYVQLWEYVTFEVTGIMLPAPLHYEQKATLFVDESENYWRAFEFIPNSQMATAPKDAAQAGAIANAFANFTASFEHFDISELHTVIPGFHDLTLRFEQFEESLHIEGYERMARAQTIIRELKNREKYKHFYEIIIQSGECPLRVMHHDAKISNVLFDQHSGDVLSIVDFDTVMPGYYFSDLGDLIRSMCGLEKTKGIQGHHTQINKEVYDAIISGYLKGVGHQLSNAEKKYIHYAGLLMTYMQALRFLTDYLNGDVYYLTRYPSQNLERAESQLNLLTSLEDFLKLNYNLR